MSTTFTIKRGDTLPILSLTLETSAAVPVVVDLTLATGIKLFFDQGGVTLERNMVIDADPTTGVATYAFTAADWGAGMFDVGSYKFEAQVTYTGGDILTIPTSGYMKLVVKPDLDD